MRLRVVLRFLSPSGTTPSLQSNSEGGSGGEGEREVWVESEESATVRELLEKVSAASAIPVSQLEHVIYDGKKLDFSSTLQQELVTENATLNVLLKQTGTSSSQSRLEELKGTLPTELPGVTSMTPPAARAKENSLVALEGSRWHVRGFSQGDVVLAEEEVKMSHSVEVKDCENTTVTIKGKVNHLLVDRCTNVTVDFVSLVSALEIVHAENTTVKFSGRVGIVQVDLAKGVHVHVLSTNEALTETKYVNANSQDVFLFVDDKELKFTIPASLVGDQMASRVSMDKETGEIVLKTLATEKMKGDRRNIVDLSMLDSVDLKKENIKEDKS